MASKAEKLNAVTGQWETVYASDLTEKDRHYTYRCSLCKTPVVLAICTEKDNYFVGYEHSVNCKEAKGRKIIRINSATKIDMSAILDYEDRDVQPEGEPEQNVYQGDCADQVEAVDEAEDLRLDLNGTRVIRTVRAMYYAFVERQGSASIDDFSQQEVDAIFLRRNTFRKFKENWGCAEKLIVTKRCFPGKLQHKIQIPKGYVLLRDAYSEDDEDAIYFMVKIKHQTHDKKFKEKLFGREPEKGEEIFRETATRRVGRDPHKNIVIFARWKKAKHSHYRVYTADLNTKMYTFLNASDVY